MSGSDRNKRYALIALGMALFAIVLLSWPGYQASDKHRTAEKAAKYENGQKYVTPPVTGKDDFNPWRDTIPNWAMAVLSFAATGFSIWAVFLVKDTLAETKKSVEAAEASVLETRRIGEAQVRAYISWTSFGGQTEFFEVDGRLNGFVIEPQIKNTGQSPAYLQAMYSDLVVIVDGEKPVVSFEPNERMLCEHVIGAGDTFNLVGMFLSAENASLVYQSKKKVFVLGWVKYKHVFSGAGDDGEIATFCFDVSFHNAPVFRRDDLEKGKIDARAVIKFHSEREYEIGPKQ